MHIMGGLILGCISTVISIAFLNKQNAILKKQFLDPESGRLTSKGSTMLMNDLNYDSALYTSINDQKLN